MKVLLSLILLLTISLTTQAQLNDNSDFHEAKIERFTKMKKNGATMGIVGGGLTLAGIVLTASADWETTSDEYGYNTTTSDGSGVIGILALTAGIPLTVTGIVLNSIGNRKILEYTDKLKNVDMSYFKHGKQSGITLAIRF